MNIITLKEGGGGGAGPFPPVYGHECCRVISMYCFKALLGSSGM